MVSENQEECVLQGGGFHFHTYCVEKSGQSLLYKEEDFTCIQIEIRLECFLPGGDQGGVPTPPGIAA